jgi:hypothetical protein
MPEDTVNPSPIYAKAVDVLVPEYRFESATPGDLQSRPIHSVVVTYFGKGSFHLDRKAPSSCNLRATAAFSPDPGPSCRWGSVDGPQLWLIALNKAMFG